MGSGVEFEWWPESAVAESVEKGGALEKIGGRALVME